jgi:DNA-binding response OmpR family regulator
MSIMLVTNDKELVKMIRESLRETTARLSGVAGSMKAATDGVQQLQPTLVILDTFVPGSSGLEVLNSIKRMSENCLFVMLSRLRTRTAVEKAFRLGAHDVLCFPLDTEVIRHTILHRVEAGLLQKADDEAAKEEEEK